VVLGYLPPSLLGGEMQLDVEAAHRAVRKVADALGLDVARAAAGIVDIANEAMLGALRLVSVQRGYDPRDFALMAFGGAGPLHGNALGRLMGAWPIVVPPGPGLLCALGDVSTAFREEFSRSYVRTFSHTSADELAVVLDDLGKRADAWLEQQGMPPLARELRYQVDVRYYRQGYALPQDVEPSNLRAGGLSELAQRFDASHQRLYGFDLPQVEREVVHVRVVGVGRMPPLPRLTPVPATSPDATEARLPGEHRAYFNGAYVPTPLYDRNWLRPGHRLSGPAIVTEMDSTTLVEPGSAAEVDETGTLLIRPV
jgi:N-methylhydantoinase A